MRTRRRGNARLRAARRWTSHGGGSLGKDDPGCNAAHVEAGRAEFLVAALEDLDLGDRRFDKIFAARVGLFHREPELARGNAERWLAPGGKLFVFYDSPANGKENP